MHFLINGIIPAIAIRISFRIFQTKLACLQLFIFLFGVLMIILVVPIDFFLGKKQMLRLAYAKHPGISSFPSNCKKL